jgi:VanZ family protein
MSVIFWLSSRPAGDYEGAGAAVSWLPGAAYFVHGALYFLLGGLLSRPVSLFRVHLPGLSQTGSAIAAATALSFLYGLSDEYHQEFVEGRGWAWQDLLADLLGAAAGAAAWAVLVHWRKRRREGHA